MRISARRGGANLSQQLARGGGGYEPCCCLVSRRGGGLYLFGGVEIDIYTLAFFYPARSSAGALTAPEEP